MGVLAGTVMILTVPLLLAVWLSQKIMRGRGLGKKLCDRVLIVSSIAAVGLFVLLFLPTFHWLWDSTIEQGTGVSLQEYHGFGISLPASASAITYYRDYGGTQATFACTEADVVTWAIANDLAIEEFRSNHTISLPELGVDVVIDDGFVVGNQGDDNGGFIALTYDRSTGRGYYRYASW